MTAALREGGGSPGARVADVSLEPLGEGVGLIGDLCRVRIRYDKAEPDSPDSLIAKFPSTHAANRATGMRFHFYECETRFYQELARGVSMRVPRCYFAGMVVASEAFVVLLEDMAPARCGDQVEGCTPDEAAIIVTTLAEFHAGWWESPVLRDMRWLPGLDRYVGAYHELYRAAYPAFLAKTAAWLPDDVRRVSAWLDGRFRVAWHRLTGAPETIIHGDYRLDNLMFPPIRGGAPLAVLDWQGVRRAHGMFDLSYFLCESLPVPERRSAERDLVTLYQEGLLRGGVTDYSLERCWDDYRLSLLVCLCRATIAVGTYDVGNERGQHLVNTLVERLFAAIMDHEVLASLPE